MLLFLKATVGTTEEANQRPTKGNFVAHPQGDEINCTRFKFLLWLPVIHYCLCFSLSFGPPPRQVRHMWLT